MQVAYLIQLTKIPEAVSGTHTLDPDMNIPIGTPGHIHTDGSNFDNEVDSGVYSGKLDWKISLPLPDY